mgnify:FL=1
MAPADEHEMRAMLTQATKELNCPVAIRYPRGNALSNEWKETLPSIPFGKFFVEEEGEEILLLGAGFMLQELKKTSAILKEHGKKPTLVNARFIKPLDTEAYRELFEKHSVIVSLEDNTLVGGYGSAIAEMLADFGFKNKTLLRMGLPDAFVEHGEVSNLYKQLKIDGESVAAKIMEVYNA